MNLFGKDRSELEAVALDLSEARFRGRQLFHGIYGLKRSSIESLSDLSKEFRRRLSERFQIAIPRVRERLVSRDLSARYLLDLEDGQAVESVFMPEEHRATLCISSQAGCAVDCGFCFTALMGLKRNLTAGEIVGQVYAALEDQALAPSARLNIVLMGMGEPLLNYEPVMKAIRLLADPEGLALPPRRITLSTSGIIPRIRDLGREPVRPKLAISLNASENEQRTSLMPLNRKYPLTELLEACREYPLRPRERLTFEYVMLAGVNDSDDDARRVAELLSGMRAKVNLIPYNSGQDLPFRAPEFGRALAFREILAERQIDAFIRISRGQDVRAACGQLALDGNAEVQAGVKDR